MREAGFVLKQLEEYCRHHTGKLLKLAAAPDQALPLAGQLAQHSQSSRQLSAAGAKNC